MQPEATSALSDECADLENLLAQRLHLGAAQLRIGQASAEQIDQLLGQGKQHQSQGISCKARTG